MIDADMVAICEAERCINDGEPWPCDRALDALKAGGIISEWHNPTLFSLELTPKQLSRLLKMLREWVEVSM